MGALREVVITGVGVTSPIGMGCSEFWQSLVEGRSGARTIDWLENSPFPVSFGTPLSDFDPKQHVKPRKSLKVMCRDIQIGVATAALATQDADLSIESIDSVRFGVVFGSQMLYGEPSELEDVYRACMQDGRFDFGPWAEAAMSDVFPLWLLKSLPNMAACHVGIAHDAQGPSNSILLGDASSLRAIVEAAHIILRDDADIMIAGGVGNRLAVTPLVYRGDANLSHRSDDLSAASRPFDADRDGMVIGEGAAAFLLESREHASGRGAKILARVMGWGEAFEWRWNGLPPTGDGFRRAIRTALRKTGLAPHEFDHVNAHGLSTVEDDPLEAQAIQDCLGDVPVTAPKSFFGNLGAGGSAVELAASVVGFAQKQVPFTLNYQTVDPACPVNVIRHEPKPLSPQPIMKLAQAGTGQTVALVVAPEEG